MRELAMPLSLALVVLAAGCVQQQDNVQQNATIQITPSGFTPNSVLISSGGTVTFVNMDSVSHWPASNPHPVHTDYPGFDAGRGLGQGESYSFTFTRTGTFGFHDHLKPAMTGIVRVV